MPTAFHLDAKKGAPAESAVVVTTSDSVNLTEPSRALYVGGTGNLTVVMTSGQVVLFSAIPAGTILPICVTRVNATATTATLIVSLY